MSKSVPPKYLEFYLDGRDERILKNQIDLGVIAHRLQEPDPPSLRDAVYAAAESVGAAHVSGRTRRKWIDEHSEAIAKADGDGDGAYAAWLQGRVDELAFKLESQIVETLGELLPSQGDGGEDDDDDGDEEEDEDDDE